MALFSFSVMLSGMITFDQLTAAAYKGERVASRRLAAREGIAEEAALRRVLELAAAEAGLAGLLAERAALRGALVAHASARNDRKAQAQAIKARRHEGPATPWRAWFDGSAHPNPGQIGIGALLCGPAGERIEISRRAGHGNSGEAEYLALTALLEAAASNGATGLVVYGDSQVVVNDVNLSAQAVAAGRGAKGLDRRHGRELSSMAEELQRHDGDDDHHRDRRGHQG